MPQRARHQGPNDSEDHSAGRAWESQCQTVGQIGALFCLGPLWQRIAQQLYHSEEKLLRKKKALLMKSSSV